MPNKYIEVPRSAIVGKLEAAGFTRRPGNGEVTYVHAHDRHPGLSVVVYTSVAEREDDARGCGEDAIRVVALFSWTRDGEQVARVKKLYQQRIFRVNSVEGVLNRMIEAARTAYIRCTHYEYATLRNRWDWNAYQIEKGWIPAPKPPTKETTA